MQPIVLVKDQKPTFFQNRRHFFWSNHLLSGADREITALDTKMIFYEVLERWYVDVLSLIKFLSHHY